MRSKLILLVAVLLIGRTATSYPILEIPMSDLIENSDVIVTGKVIDVLAHNESTLKTAYILVNSNLKGQNHADTIHVNFYTETFCPELGKYKIGTTILTFLSLKDSEFRINGFSHGVRIIDEKMPDFEKMILDYISISEIENSTLRRNKQLNWLIETIENPAIRAEGLIMLAPANFRSYETSAEMQKKDLTPDQIQRLAAVLIGLEQFYFVDLRLIDLVIESHCDQVLDWSNKQLEGIFAQKKQEIDTFMARHILIKINRALKDSPILTELTNAFVKEDLQMIRNKQKLKSISLKFIEEAKKACG